MTESLWILTLSAASIAFIHTVIGPDHYLPFIMIAKAQRWPLVKTLSVTVMCGVGHVLGSVALGAIGIATGIALQQLELVESIRGELAAWLLIGFGLVYGAWGLYRALRNRRHSHAIDDLVHGHAHEPGHADDHTHQSGGHVHGHAKKRAATMWTLFIVFVLGPCEPLIPLLMFPAAAESPAGVAWIAWVFGVVTIATMTAMVAAVHTGIARLPLRALDRYVHALAGGVIALSGIAIQALGV